ncbi:thioredoxin family protein [Alienimonas californiensis]|uniref:Disulfide bond reductase DsbH n=1 Tax=Alienimonas californiensis TaxID=2527989 RepID=A0A517P5T2_9PLAN|nr:thioredoxin family protein [Alienimonas californiensis]QDT14748.1 Disulfide bond reductase DsbH precursor [Alienimonas californiensis]
MSRSLSRPSFVPALLCGLAACGAALGFGGCTSGSGGLADSAAVEQAAALSGEPLPIHDWTTDLAVARQTAAAEGKDVLMLFTGSDWCPPCMALEKSVFAQAPASRLEDDFVPVLFDFPNKKAQAPEIAARNQQVQEAYGVAGYPTVLLTSADGSKYGELHYQDRYESGGAAAFLADAKALRAANGAAGDAEPSVGGRPAAAE